MYLCIIKMQFWVLVSFQYSWDTLVACIGTEDPLKRPSSTKVPQLTLDFDVLAMAPSARGCHGRTRFLVGGLNPSQKY